MQRNWMFSISHWLTFTLALTCLAVVDTTAPIWLYPMLCVALTMVMAYPGRWNLSALAANLLGLGLIIAWLIWINWEFSSQHSGGRLSGDEGLRVGFIRGGTLLALLLLAKWLRPRSAGDYWMMHALALVQVVLACATLVTRPEDLGYRWFPFLLLLYLASGVWAVIVLQMYRESASGDPGQTAPITPRRFWLWRLAVGSGLWWCSLGLVLALILFLTIPRLGSSSDTSWLRVGTLSQSLSGISGGIDLTVGDTLRLSDELVVRMDAWDSAGNKVWLGEDLRLRVLTCSSYSLGKWRPGAQDDLTYVPYRYPISTNSAGSYRLQFHADLTKLPAAVGLDVPGLEQWRFSSAYPLPLAEPHPALAKPRWAHWFHADTELMGVGVVQREPAVWVALAGSARILRYEQLYDRSATSPEGPLPQPRTSDLLRLPSFAQPWFSTAPTRDLAYEPLDQLPRSLRNSGRLEKLSMQILQRHRLPPRPVPGEDADQVLSKVKVLEGYLANNPTEFVYALSRSRLRHDLDPTEEFLLEPVTPDGKKAGWCQHYASALALLLRAQQIPARIVIGFRGGEWNPNWRTHEIRAYHAHAWVEAFIGPRGLDGRISQGRWLIFEPTPSTALSVLPIRQASWWRMLMDDLRFLWEIIMLDGATGQGFRSFATINNLLEKWHLADLESQELLLALGRAAGALALAVIAFIVWQRLRARRDARFQRSDTLVPTTEWERTLVQWLSRILPARPTHQSLLEYAQAAQNWLQAHGCPSSALCNLPVRMTEAYYRYRFAGIPPASSELADFRAQLSELARWLELVQKP